ncbi:MAG TPA: FixH family protein [Burkholderiales bacterium]|nr:FixH family protein [Burkholderiales bacterium]
MTPWHKEPWAWFVMGPPAVAVVAGLLTWWIAAHGADPLVAEDYYRQGLAVNRDLAREARAHELRLSAEVQLGGGRIRVSLEGAAPEALFVQVTHRTRAGFDQRLRLAHAGGAYEAQMLPLPPGGWRVRIEDPRGTWRLVREGS